MTLEQLAKQGKRNSMTRAASISSQVGQIKKQSIKDAFVDLQHWRHRSELVYSHNAVDYIDDSGAVSPVATWFTMENINAPLVWITGCGEKCLDYEDLVTMAHRYVKYLIFVGDDMTIVNDTFGDVLNDRILHAKTLDEAVIMASELASPSEKVLFSPSTDVDDSFVDSSQRGDMFQNIVRNLNILYGK